MKKNLIKIALFGLVAVFSATFVGCKDYDDDIKKLQTQIDSVKDAVKALEDKVGSGKYVESATAFTEGNGGYEIAFSDGTSIKLNNGAKGDKGDQGDKGDKGDPGTATTSKYVVSVDYDEEEAFYVVTFNYSNGDEPTVIKIPAATKAVTGIKFIPDYLSPGEAARIHFPVIVTDSLFNPDRIDNKNYPATVGVNEGALGDFHIVYSGKGEFRYQVNPHSASFDAFDEIALVREDAEIWNYSTNNGKWMLFNPAQAWYTNGILSKDKAYAEGNGILRFRAKDWTFAERTDLNERNVYALSIQNGDNVIHSDFIPAKHEPILQKNVHLVRKNDAGTPATAPNTQNYSQYDADVHYRKSVNPNDNGEFLSNEAAVEAYAENQYYKSLTPIYEILYTGQSIDLSKDVMSFFNNRLGRPAANEYILEENGFDDYKLVFETVNFYNEGVNQSKRYLSVTEAGVATVTLNSLWAKPGEGESHTAAINRTPIVRVSLVAPGEDNFNVVKTAIIKLKIVEKPTEPITINYSKEVTLLHVNQEIKVDMDEIFVASGLSKEKFRDAYTFNPRPNAALEAENQQRVSIDDRINVDGEFNQLMVTVTNTAYHADHVVYVARGEFVPTYVDDPSIFVNYTVKVKYPAVKAPTKAPGYWYNNGNIADAHGRMNTGSIDTANDYEMVAVLNQMFDLTTYNPLVTTGQKDAARAVLSFELVEEHNMRSGAATYESGLELYEKADGTWELALRANDEGRRWINEHGVRDVKVKVRAVVSFNECVDAEYGSCTSGADAPYKYAKTAINAINCEEINTVNGTNWPAATNHYQDYSLNAGIAPETGRSTVVIEEFDVAFMNPLVFNLKNVAPIYDKYANESSKRDVADHFTMYTYLNANGVLTDATTLDNNTIFDPARANGRNIDGDGWNTRNEIIFDVNRNIHYWIDGIKFHDGTAVTPGTADTNISLVGSVLTWDNQGADLQKAVDITIGICVNHKWGQICNHTWNTATTPLGKKYGDSTGYLNVRVLTYDGKLELDQ